MEKGSSMFHKLIRTGVVAMIIVGLTVSVALAAEEWVSGRVKSVDAQKGTLSITTEDDSVKQLSVSKELLKGVQPGHEVDVEIVDGKVKNLENYSSDR